MEGTSEPRKMPTHNTCTSEVLGGEFAFEQAEALWQATLNNIVTFINQSGGQASKGATFSERFDIED